MVKIIKHYELNRISRILIVAIITYIIGNLVIKEYEKSKTVYNFVDLQMKYKNYILVTKREVLLMMKNISSHYVILLQTKIVLYM